MTVQPEVTRAPEPRRAPEQTAAGQPQLQLETKGLLQAFCDGVEVTGIWIGSRFVWPDPWQDVWREDALNYWDSLWHDQWSLTYIPPSVRKLNPPGGAQNGNE